MKKYIIVMFILVLSAGCATSEPRPRLPRLRRLASAIYEAGHNDIPYVGMGKFVSEPSASQWRARAATGKSLVNPY